MGLKSVVEQIEAIFSKKENFDESGFANFELVESLERFNDKDIKNLEKLGYGFHWFNEAKTDGIVYKQICEKPRIRYVRRLYFNQSIDKKEDEVRKDG